MADKPKPIKHSFATRSSIGALFKAVTLSTDPGHTLGFTSSLINQTRAALVYKLEQQQPDVAEMPKLFNTILTMLAKNWQDTGCIDAESRSILDKRIDIMFKSDWKIHEDLQTYRDVTFCDDLHERWIYANEIYLKNPMAWSHSNELLANINKQLMEIITRHDLMEFPRGESFNLDDHGTGIGGIAAMLATRKEDMHTDNREGERM
jgi:hypothetical protein